MWHSVYIESKGLIFRWYRMNCLFCHTTGNWQLLRDIALDDMVDHIEAVPEKLGS